MSDYLDRVEAELAKLTDRGAHRRLRARSAASLGSGVRATGRRTEAFALAATLAIVVAVAAVLLSANRAPRPAHPASSQSVAATHSSSPAITTDQSQATTAQASSAPPMPPGGPVPAGFAPSSFTAISELTWWLLGTAPCANPPCTSLVRTTDGGLSFVGIPAPRTQKVSEVRFADAADGFAYGPQLWATHNGGRDWQQVRLAGQVTDLALSGGEAYAVVDVSGGGNGGVLLRSPVGRDDWTLLTAKRAVYGGLWAHGADVLAQAGDQTQLLVSHDSGRSFARYPAPTAGLPCQFEEPSTPVVWAHCATGTESGVWRSTDGGRSFQPASGGGQGLRLPNSAAFGSASPTTAVVGYQQLFRTSDGGASYTPVGPAGITEWNYLGFTDATHGVALGLVTVGSQSRERLYYTTDGGLTYHLVAIR